MTKKKKVFFTILEGLPDASEVRIKAMMIANIARLDICVVISVDVRGKASDSSFVLSIL